MTLVRIIKDWDYPDILSISPHHSGIWNGVKFTTEPVKHCDYVIVLNLAPEDIDVHCPPEHVWQIYQEPPVQQNAWRWQHQESYARIYTLDSTNPDPRFIPSFPALPWHLGMSYDEIVAMPLPDKPKKLTWITSNLTWLDGHKTRMAFLDHIKNHIDFDLWGRGFEYIEKKFDGLAPYRYSIAVESWAGRHYWTEKLADAYLTWTMPIYYGCTNIDEYFPEEAMIKIDIEHPEEAVEIIQEAISSDLYLKRRDAIQHCRELILDEYNFFGFFARLIEEQEETYTHSRPAPEWVHLPAVIRPRPQPATVPSAPLTPKRSLVSRAANKLRRNWQWLMKHL